MDKEFEIIAKIRKKILDNINRHRFSKEMGKFFIDIISNQIATEYSLFLMSNEHDMSIFEALLLLIFIQKRTV